METKEEREIFRRRLEQALSKVPTRIANGSIQETRAWMRNRDAAAKLVKKPGATVAQLLSAITSLE